MALLQQKPNPQGYRGHPSYSHGIAKGLIQTQLKSGLEAIKHTTVVREQFPNPESIDLKTLGEKIYPYNQCKNPSSCITSVPLPQELKQPSSREHIKKYIQQSHKA